MTAAHGRSVEVRNHDVWWDVSLLLVDGRQLLLVVGSLLLHAAVGVVHGVVRHAVALGHHLLLTAHLDSVAGLHLGAALLVSSSAVLAAVPPVLDGIVAATSQTSGDLGPALAHLGNHLLNHGTLFRADWLMVEVWLEVLVIPLTALLGRASLDHG